MCFLSTTYAGKAPDKSLAALEGYTLPQGSYRSQDVGVQGDTRAGITIVQPQKNPPGGERTPPAQAAHRAISSIRSRLEHAMGGVRRYRLVKDKSRRWKDGMRETILETCGGLHSFRLQYRPWNYAN